MQQTKTGTFCEFDKVIKAISWSPIFYICFVYFVKQKSPINDKMLPSTVVCIYWVSLSATINCGVGRAIRNDYLYVKMNFLSISRRKMMHFNIYCNTRDKQFVWKGLLLKQLPNSRGLLYNWSSWQGLWRVFMVMLLRKWGH